MCHSSTTSVSRKLWSAQCSQNVRWPRRLTGHNASLPEAGQPARQNHLDCAQSRVRTAVCKSNDLEMAAPRRRRSRVGKSATQCRTVVLPLHHNFSGGVCGGRQFVRPLQVRSRHCAPGHWATRQCRRGGSWAVLRRQYNLFLIGSRFTYGVATPSTTYSSSQF